MALTLKAAWARFRERRRICGLPSALRWARRMAVERSARAAGAPLWSLKARWDPAVRPAVPGRDPERLAAQIGAVTTMAVERFRMEVSAYRDYLEKAAYPRGCYGSERDLRAPFHEKTLEHFIAFELIKLRAGESLLDVASNLSPVPDLAERLFGAVGWRQDLGYPAGVRGRSVGSAASRIPLPDASIDAITLHCAFEHFEGDEDRLLIDEAARLLRPSGRLCILPLYLSEKAINVTNRLWGGRRFMDPEVSRFLRVRNRDGRFSRFYDPDQLHARILDRARSFRRRILFLENHDAVSPYCYLKFILLLERLP